MIVITIGELIGIGLILLGLIAFFVLWIASKIKSWDDKEK